ncbi:MAG: molybdenum cofactor biosynthesis protein MoaE [Bacteroidetes bacterium]|nr:molybdenum cofactor biosynthesis protein MoaE [Bacteroidota bacterium]
MADYQEILVTENPLEVEKAYAHAQAGNTGAVNIFVGTVRNKTDTRNVVNLEYEAYEGMAIKEMRKIAEEAASKWPVEKIIIHHRVGKLRVGEATVVIAVSTPHRHDSFEACRYIIDTLKKSVPIWKKEVFEDGEEWVSAHP